MVNWQAFEMNVHGLRRLPQDSNPIHNEKANEDTLATSPVDAIRRLLHPESIAIVGVSEGGRSIGGYVLDNLERFGYSGQLHLISQKNDTVRGRPCIRSVAELPQNVDVAILTVPESVVLETVRTCGERGVGSVVVFAAGYAEAGAEGRQKQEQLAEVARQAGIALVGPNCMGLTNYRDDTPLTFETVEPYHGRTEKGLSIVAQSGAMANNIRDAMIGRGISVTYSVSTGNEAGLTLEDYIEYFISDDHTHVIAVYAEQIRRPQQFLALAREAREAGKPIVLMMIGRSERAKAAAQSHTGALTSDYATARTLLEHEGVLVTDTLDELFDVIPILLRQPQPAPEGLAFVTGSGAMKNIALDLGGDLGIDFPAFAPETEARLREILPGYAVSENPLDYTTIAVRSPAAMGTVIDTVAADPNCGCMIVAQMGGSAQNQQDKAEYMVPAVARASRAAALVIMGDDSELHPSLVAAARESGVPFFRSPDRALRAMSLVNRYGRTLARLRQSAPGAANASALRLSGLQAGTMPEYEGKNVLAQAGIPVPAGKLARTPDEAVEFARALGFPVVLKAQAAALAHKSDLGGVTVNIRDANQLRQAWEQMSARIAQARPGLQLDGFLVEAMGKPGLELVVGARRDAEWGPVVLVGLGGIWIEVMNDVRLVPATADQAHVRAELERLKSARLLHGLRGQPPVDIDAVARTVTRVGELMLANPQIAEVDINPLVAYPDGVLALDALIVVQE